MLSRNRWQTSPSCVVLGTSRQVLLITLRASSFAADQSRILVDPPSAVHTMTAAKPLDNFELELVPRQRDSGFHKRETAADTATAVETDRLLLPGRSPFFF
eukprot:Protomagalhaensia_wolfi_Nauph_80__4961@NODE_5234_length_421_cov_23_683246_g4289_i0_p1_GENE_NODE_5234_length_421_cov_23_683246_g4289_i0NODE_5234_length_421_cov_23_683246_g4289_i0_p1_ORF_typecomplete_len101_score5_17_NODE_5234_length_421_cov_23_683246_g4289_i012314